MKLESMIFHKTVNEHVANSNKFLLLFPSTSIPSIRPHSTKIVSIMSDSSDDNLSDLEQDHAVDGIGSDGEEEEKPELKGILDDVEETTVTWKDLVS